MNQGIRNLCWNESAENEADKTAGNYCHGISKVYVHGAFQIAFVNLRWYALVPAD